MILLVYTNISHLKERLKEKARTPPSSTQESLPYASEVHTHTRKVEHSPFPGPAGS